MNGRQLAETARERRPSLPVLFITGFAGAALHAGQATGMEVLGKSFKIDSLAARVQRMVEDRGPWGSEHGVSQLRRLRASR